MAEYRKRIADSLLARKLAGMGAVLVEGAKWCGKTTTCEQLAKSVLYLADPKKRESLLQLAKIDIARLLEGAKPRLIDEWQDVAQFKRPAFRMVLTATGDFAYRRPEDGIIVCPVTALKD